MSTVKIRGQRGSWFATVKGKKLPIMWGDELSSAGDKMFLQTDWLETARDETASKRAALVSYFDDCMGEETQIIIATARDPNARPREIDSYVGVFLARVINTDPEIELEIVKRIADAKK